MKNEIKAMGELITKNLGIQNNYDVLNKWMITYIAEQMYIYETANTIEEKQIAGEKCSDAIIKFWSNRTYNTGWNPMEKYKELLDKLNRMTSIEYGVDIINFISNKTIDKNGDIVETTKIIRKVCSWLIEDIFLREFGEVRNADENHLIEILDDLGEPDAGVIKIVSDMLDRREDIDNDYQQYRIKKAEYVIELLNEFVHLEKEKAGQAL